MSRAAPVLYLGLMSRFWITVLLHLRQQNRIGWQHGRTPVFFQSWAPPLPKQDHARTSGAPAWTLIHFRSWLQVLFVDVFVTMLWPFVRQSDSQSVEKFQHVRKDIVPGNGGNWSLTPQNMSMGLCPRSTWSSKQSPALPGAQLREITAILIL